MTSLPECTKAGSAYVGEFKILREYSFDEAMTMKLFLRLVYNHGTRSERDLHIENANGTQRTRIPLPFIVLHGRLG
jgi:hypothetical protein